QHVALELCPVEIVVLVEERRLPEETERSDEQALAVRRVRREAVRERTRVDVLHALELDARDLRTIPARERARCLCECRTGRRTERTSYTTDSRANPPPDEGHHARNLAIPGPIGPSTTSRCSWSQRSA